MNKITELILSEFKIYYKAALIKTAGFPGGEVVKNPSANAGDVTDTGSIFGWERSPGGEHDNPLQYSCLEDPMDRGAWLAIVHAVKKSGHN